MFAIGKRFYLRNNMNLNMFIGVAIATEGALVAITKQFSRKQGATAKPGMGHEPIRLASLRRNEHGSGTPS